MIDDQQALDGKAAALYNTGDGVRFELADIKPGTYEVSVRARGDHAQGWPVVRLSTNAEQVGTNLTVNRKRYKNSSADQVFGEVSLKAGDILDLVFVNGSWGGADKKDRNLYIDHLSLTPVGVAELVPAPSPEPISGSSPEPTPEPEPAPEPLTSANPGADYDLTVDVAAVRSAEAIPPVGLGLNAVRDNLDLGPAAEALGIKTLRWSPLDAYFDKSAAPKFKVGIEDPSNYLNFSVDEDGYRQHDLNFDDFVSVAKSIGAEPIIDVYVHSAIYEGSLPHGDWDTIVQAAADWVEYANITQGYGVKRWEIGNEVDLEKNGWDVEQYARMVEDMSTAMKAVDPTIEVGINGMTGKSWWDELLPKVGKYADYLVSHQYSWYTSYDQWSTDAYTVGGNVDNVLYARDKYTPDLPIVLTEISALNPSQSDEPNSVWRALHNIEVQAMGYYKGSAQKLCLGKPLVWKRERRHDAGL